MIIRRFVHSGSRSQFKINPDYKLKCGIEIHTQLKTRYKLFSLSPNSYSTTPNSNISYFDCGLPGTLPKLNPEALLLALKTAVALNSDIQTRSSFDRKHYFYSDQPLGYQITQHYHPIALNGHLKLLKKFDDVKEDKIINIEQIQLEQDTGKTNYDKFDKVIKVDLNRANVPLIELVTKPDFTSPDQVKAFLKKYWTLVTNLDICSGDLENGAMRVDVNVSINGGNRVEIKNLGSTGEILDAMKYEYHRQIECSKRGEVIDQETRGWTGKETVRARSKEDAVDYRYFPDSELPWINLDSKIGDEIRASLPELPDEVIAKLIAQPFSLDLKHAKFFVNHPEILDYYKQVFTTVVDINNKPAKLVNNWIIHELLGAFNKLSRPVTLSSIPPSKLSTLILSVANDEISLTSAKLLLQQVIKNQEDQLISVEDLIVKYDLGKPTEISKNELEEAIEEICHEIIENNPTVVEKILAGKKKSINFLIGLAMKETQGKVSSKTFEAKFKELIEKSQ